MMNHFTIQRVRVIVVLLLVLGAFLAMLQLRSASTYSAYFERTTGLHEGNEVKVLGVKVGEVTQVKPGPTRVRVEFEVDSDQKLPQDVKVALIAPSLVSGRFIQLAPAYSGGPALTPGSSIPMSRTAVPVEFDEVKEQVTRLAQALGPRDGDKGALNEVITVTAKNLDAKTAQNLRDSLDGMSKAVATISTNRDDIFQTVRGVDSFVSNLVANESALRSFSDELDSASRFLAAERHTMADALELLQQILGELTTFVESNRGTLTSSIKSLATLTGTLSEEKTQLANALHRAPTVMGNYYNIQDPHHGGVIGRPVLNYFSNVAQFTCGLVLGVGGTSAQCSQALQSMLEALRLNQLPGAPGNPIASEDGTNPLAPALTGTAGRATAANDLNLQEPLRALTQRLGTLLGGGQQ